ncbi:DUF397 domain-containing protein [Streptomyces sp. NPDC059564]|uniref:DUF397 domain-containing protein n=1 Tax=Streptomyces sp. NPDC059564 TaxID=3346865 RepID=UPI003679CF49
MSPNDWQRSSFCAEGDSCVYVARGHEDRVLVADTPTPETVITVSAPAWAVFLSGGTT